MVRGMAILFGFQGLGELVRNWVNWPIPGSVLGMALLLVALGVGAIKLEWIDETSELLLSNLSIFFIPAGVGVMVHFDYITAEWIPILSATFISTFIVMAVSGKVADLLEKEEQRNE